MRPAPTVFAQLWPSQGKTAARYMHLRIELTLMARVLSLGV